MLAIVAHRASETNRALAVSVDDGVLPTLDGVEPGLWALGALAERGVRVLNPPSALLTSHDKLLTARALSRAGLPHPRTRLVLPGDTPEVEGAVVVKPRFGSWGDDVLRCRDGDELEAALAEVST